MLYVMAFYVVLLLKTWNVFILILKSSVIYVHVGWANIMLQLRSFIYSFIHPYI